MSNAADKVRLLIFGIRQDIALYRQLEQLLCLQREHMCLRDNDKLTQNNAKQIALIEALKKNASQRTELLTGMRLTPDAKGISLLLSKLPTKAAHSMQLLWSTLEDTVKRCHEHNDYNGRLLANQQQIIKRILEPNTSFYQP